MDHPFSQELEQRHPGALETVSERLADLQWNGESSVGEEGQDLAIWISDIQMINAANHMISGSFWLGGKEISFLAESGDMNGFVWRELSDTDPIPAIEIEHTKFALQPMRELVSQAISDGKGPFLVMKWEAILPRAFSKSGTTYAEIPGKYGYDRRFSPGERTETYWREQAAKGRFEIVPQDVAAQTRESLLSATEPLVDVSGLFTPEL